MTLRFRPPSRCLPNNVPLLLLRLAENNFEIYENLNRDDNFPVKSTRKRLTSRGSNLMRRHMDRRSTASDEEPLEEMTSFRQLGNNHNHQGSSGDQKRNSIVAESIISCESEVSTTSTFICSNQSDAASSIANNAERSSGVGGANVASAASAAAAVPMTTTVSIDRDRDVDLGTSRTPHESDEDNVALKSKYQQRRHAINITSNPGYQVSGCPGRSFGRP